MAVEDYIVVPQVVSPGGNISAVKWEYAKFIIAQLKANGCVTRGSSRDGTAGTAFSATPDGVDHWDGRGQPDAANSTVVWHVVEHTESGVQFCVRINPVGFGVFDVIYSMNKFESGGAWRAGGTNANTRPADTTSSPAAGRECATSGLGNPPGLFSAGNNRYGIAVRRPGEGFGFVSWYWQHDSASSHAWFGVLPFSVPFAADENPRVCFYVAGNSAAWTSGGTEIVGRAPDGTVQRYQMTVFGDTTIPEALSPWENKRPAFRMMLYDRVSKVVRYYLPDILVIAGNPHNNYATYNDLDYFGMGNSGASSYKWLVPWDGTTVLGVDTDVFVVPEGEGGAAEEPATIINVEAPELPDILIKPAGPTEPDFGLDIAAFDDIMPSLTLVGGATNLLLALARRFITEAGQLRDLAGDLAEGAGEYGFDMRSRLNAEQTIDELDAAGRIAEAQCLLDPRVTEASAIAEFDLAASALKIDVRVETDEGPYDLVLAVTKLTVSVLSGSGEVIA